MLTFSDQVIRDKLKAERNGADATHIAFLPFSGLSIQIILLLVPSSFSINVSVCQHFTREPLFLFFFFFSIHCHWHVHSSVVVIFPIRVIHWIILTDLAQSVKDDIAAYRKSDLLRQDVSVRGFVYDVKTGKLEEVQV